MKKVDVRITITDNNGEDNIFAMFVPVINGDEYEESESIIEEISRFINNNIINKAKKPNRVMYEKPVWRKSILKNTDNYKPESFYKENFMEKSFGEWNIYDEPSLFPKERTSTVVRPNVFGLNEDDNGPIEAVTINFLSLKLTENERVLIDLNLPIGTLQYNIHFKKQSIYRNNAKYKIIDNNIKKIIIEKANYDAETSKLLENNTLYASSGDAYFLNKYINNAINRTGSDEIFIRKQNAKTNHSNIIVKDYRDANDKKSTTLIYSTRGVLYATNKQEKFKAKIKNSELQKITNIVDEEKHYIDFGTIDLSVDLYITDDALKTIMGRFNLTYGGLKESVFSYIFCPKKLLIK